MKPLTNDVSLEKLVPMLNRAREKPQEIVAELEELLKQIDDKHVYRPPNREFAIQLTEGKPAVEEAIKVLKDAKPIAPLSLESGCGLTRAAQDCVEDLCATGATSGGRDFTERATNYGNYKGVAREVKMFGEEDMTVADVFYRLLVDDGNPKRSKRDLLLNPKLKIMGAKSAKHGPDGAIIVMIFAEEYTDNENAKKEGPPVKEILPELSPDDLKDALADEKPEVSLEALVDEMNRARQKPKLFANYLISRMQYFHGLQYHPPAREGGEKPAAILSREGLAAVKDAVQHLQRQEELRPLTAEPGKGLTLSASDKCFELAEAQTTSGAKNFGERVARYGEHSGNAQELTFFFDKGATAREIVAKFLINDGDAARSHRKTVLNEQLKIVGAATAAHPTNENSLVMILCEGYTENKEKVEARQAAGKPVAATGA
eukprot:Selendium_serpulae@DN6299_c0_g2_i6.p1